MAKRIHAKQKPLREPEITHETYEKEAVSFIDDCIGDPSFYLPASLYIRTKKKTLDRFVLNDAQRQLMGIAKRQMAENGKVRMIILKARQQGVSTFCEGLLFWHTATNENTNSLIMAHDADATDYVFTMAKVFYDNLLPEVKPLVRYSNRKELWFENSDEKARGEEPGLRSRFVVASANDPDTMRGWTLHGFHGSEVARYPRPKDLMLAVMQAIPDDGQTIITLESTAKGIGGWFYDEYWRAAAGDSEFEAVFLPWHLSREYRARPPNNLLKGGHLGGSGGAIVGGRLDLNEDEVELRERYGLDDEQIYWRRKTIRNKCGGDVAMWDQEYPLTAEAAFMVSGLPIFDPKQLRPWLMNCPEPVWRGNIEPAGDLRRLSKGNLRVWEWPEKKREYVIGVDVAEGIADGDYTCAQVVDRETWCQVAEWHGHARPDQFVPILMALGLMYNRAKLAVEVNNHGISVIDGLRGKYPNLYCRAKYENVTREWRDILGWQTNSKTKPLMVDNMAKAIRGNTVIINSRETILECLSFKQDEDNPKKMNAETGSRDDRVIALAIALKVAGELAPPREAAEDLRRKWGPANATERIKAELQEFMLARPRPAANSFMGCEW